MKRQRGFSLMEMMIVLTIVAIVAAASAPMVNKKMVRDSAAATGDSPWRWTNGAGSSAMFNFDSNDNVSAIIGRNSVPSDLGNPRLYIDTSNNTNNTHIAFGNNGNTTMRLIAGGNNSNLWFSGATIPYNVSNSVVLGIDAEASSDSTAIGKRAIANPGYLGATAIGSDVQAIKSSTVAIGGKFGAEKTTANGIGSIALGVPAKASGNHSIAIGGTNSDGLPHSEYKPYTTEAQAEKSIAIGTRAMSSGANSISIGSKSSVQSKNSIAIGSEVDNRAADAIAFGNCSKIGANGTHSIAIGHLVISNSSDAIAIGSGAFVYGENLPNAIAIGRDADGRGANVIAIGYKAAAKGNNSIAIGREAYTSFGDSFNEQSISIGAGSKTGGTSALAIGTSATATKSYSGAIGYKAVAAGSSSMAIGDKATTDEEASCSVAIGYEAKATKESEIVLGSQWATVNIPGTLVYRALSDRRLKNVGKTFKGGLAEIKKLEVFNYTFKNDEDKTPHVGIMAQDLKKVFPDAVTKGEDGFLRIRREDMFYALINAVKELDSRTVALEQKQKRIDELEKRVEKLEKRLEKLEKGQK